MKGSHSLYNILREEVEAGVMSCFRLVMKSQTDWKSDPSINKLRTKIEKLVTKELENHPGFNIIESEE